METNKKKYSKSVSYDDCLIEKLRSDPEYAAGYLATCFEETGDTPELFLLALSDVIKAFGGIETLSKYPELNRENIYQTLNMQEQGFNQLKAVFQFLNITQKTNALA